MRSGLRRADEADLPAIVAFLEARLERAMFPLANLRDHGLDRAEDGAAAAHPFAMTFWLAEAPDRVAGVLGQTAHGILLPALPQPVALAGAGLRGVTGIVGPTAEVRHTERALGLGDAPRSLDRDEPHLALDLARLLVPDGPGELQPMAAAPEPEIRGWMADYHRGALQTPEHLVDENVDRWWQRALAEDTHRVLMSEGRPLAMTGFNARLPTMVQIGGVYTPPGLRGQGLARRAVALDLWAAREAGVLGATLFAASPAAVRAYEAVGFRRIGDWTLLIFDGPQHV